MIKLQGNVPNDLTEIGKQRVRPRWGDRVPRAYPDAPKPEGPFRILEGDEYDAARALANKTNSSIHRKRPELAGLQIHEVHPVKFGGSPTDIDNKIVLTPKEHAQYTTFWNKKLKGMN